MIHSLHLRISLLHILLTQICHPEVAVEILEAIGGGYLVTDCKAPAHPPIFAGGECVAPDSKQ